MKAITAALALEAAPYGIRVVATAPGGTEAPPRRVVRGPQPEGAERGLVPADRGPDHRFLAHEALRDPRGTGRRRSRSWPPTRPPTSPAACSPSPAATWASIQPHPDISPPGEHHRSPSCNRRIPHPGRNDAAQAPGATNERSTRVHGCNPQEDLRWVMAIAAAALLFDGYDLVVYGTVVSSLLRDPSQLGALDAAQAGALGSYALMGVMVGALAAGAVGDFLGRRKMMLINIVWFSVGMALTVHGHQRPCFRRSSGSSPESASAPSSRRPAPSSPNSPRPANATSTTRLSTRVCPPEACSPPCWPSCWPA